jgi:hypothetical protein
MTEKKDKPKPVLTAQEDIFVKEYLECWNATEAYAVSHPKNKSRGAASVGGSKYLRNPKIRAAIEAGLKAKAMGADEVLARLADMAAGSQYPFIKIKDDGAVYFNFKDPEAKKHLYLIKKLKTKRTRRMEGRGKTAEEWEDEWVEVELHDPQKALELIGKHHKLFTDQLDVNLTPTLTEDQIAERITALMIRLQARKQEDQNAD